MKILIDITPDEYYGVMDRDNIIEELDKRVNELLYTLKLTHRGIIIKEIEKEI